MKKKLCFSEFDFPFAGGFFCLGCLEFFLVIVALVPSPTLYSSL